MTLKEFNALTAHLHPDFQLVVADKQGDPVPVVQLEIVGGCLSLLTRPSRQQKRRRARD